MRFSQVGIRVLYSSFYTHLPATYWLCATAASALPRRRSRDGQVQPEPSVEGSGVEGSGSSCMTAVCLTSGAVVTATVTPRPEAARAVL
eukprot:2201605-Rhodomonas_salina.1